ncbi:unnamed protein product [Linum tenue]|uniref:Retrotransposon Copia-like N-terminal domain-containing protein n=1 Tax=Linum tenue TaxID=586396 RepID=A0AAV0RRL1_9ROSI|nr:unnamed protein product [Linum tenue]
MNTPPGSQGRPDSSSGNASQGSQGTQAGNGTGPRAFQFGSFDEQQQQQIFAGARNDVITFGNPYYLNPNEALNQSIGSEVFDGSNYTMWSRSVIMGLKMKHKLGFIDGTIPMPARTDPNFLLWDGCNTAVLSWILNSLDKDLRRSVMSHVNARVLWDELKRRYGKPNAIRITNLEDDIHKCKQGTQTINQYYTEIKGLWEEYLQFNPIVPCNCAPGNPNPCDAVVAYTERQEADYLIRFLRGLNPDFEIIKSQLLAQKPLPTVSEAVDDLLQYEQKLKAEKGSAGKKAQSVALAAETLPQGSGQRSQGRKYCIYCKRPGHLVDECWRAKRKKDADNGSSSGGSTTSKFAGSVSQVSSGDSSTEVSYNSDTPDGSPVSPAKVVAAFTPEEVNRLRLMMQTGANLSPSPPHSPSISHHAYSVSQYLPPFPNFSGPANKEDDWFSKRE